ncbi:hypothetical protein O9929_16070 [Vibrio lentus]|nr:hypothetical protein [Vibrio lentus]
MAAFVAVTWALALSTLAWNGVGSIWYKGAIFSSKQHCSYKNIGDFPETWMIGGNTIYTSDSCYWLIHRHV